MHGVSKATARDYIYKRLAELKHVILSNRSTKREEAKKERAFLESQLALVYADSQWREKLDPALARAVHDSTLRSSRSGRKSSSQSRTRTKDAPHATPKKTPAVPVERPPYWNECTKLDFGQLRQFIDDCLQKPSGGDPGGQPRSKDEFLDLLEMLRAKSGVTDLLPLLQQRKSLLDKQRQLKERLAEIRRKRSTTKQTQRINEVKRKLNAVDQDLIRVHAKLQEKRRQRQFQRLRIIERIQRDIDHAFKFGAIVPTSRLPWRVLPPGELSVDNVLHHYSRLQRSNPHIRYERERIIKAYSLRPDRCYVGQDEFEGYIVLTFDYTPKALLECPIFGNAIYVLHSDWKRWSKMTKQQLVHHSDQVTRIVHKGDWFWRVKQELAVR